MAAKSFYAYLDVLGVEMARQKEMPRDWLCHSLCWRFVPFWRVTLLIFPRQPYAIFKSLLLSYISYLLLIMRYIYCLHLLRLSRRRIKERRTLSLESISDLNIVRALQGGLRSRANFSDVQCPTSCISLMFSLSLSLSPFINPDIVGSDIEPNDDSALSIWSSLVFCVAACTFQLFGIDYPVGLSA